MLLGKLSGVGGHLVRRRLAARPPSPRLRRLSGALGMEPGERRRRPPWERKRKAGEMENRGQDVSGEDGQVVASRASGGDVAPPDRRWETWPVGGGAGGGAGAVDLTVMSYNILSQDLLRDNAHLYSHCRPEALDWSHRLPNLLAELRQHDADVLCLQEVQADHFETQIKDALRAQGYDCVYKKRTGQKVDGCAVAFKTSRFSLLSSNPVEFFRAGDALLDRHNVGLVVLLRPRDGGRGGTLCVANTHLLFNPRRGDVKLAQLAVLLAEMERRSRLPDAAKLLCGDLNSTPWSPLLTFLLAGRLRYRHLPANAVSGQERVPRGPQRLLPDPIWSLALGINRRCQYESPPASSAAGPISPALFAGGGGRARAIPFLSAFCAGAEEGVASGVPAKGREEASKSWHLEHHLCLRSSYGPRLWPDGSAAVTTYHAHSAAMVDYILYTPWGSKGRGLQLLGRLSLAGQAQLERAGGLPNARHSSDHVPLLARFRWHLGERS
ncbi:protein angel homolog 2 isoform X2 [Stigmatopora nigra]